MVGCSMTSNFDVEMAIADLLADSSRASLELPPSLTAEQRRQAKKVVEKYANITCESFGLGKDRQMHVFKAKSGGQLTDASPQGVSVKNTFIDDWVDLDRKDGSERQVQTLPRNMFGRCSLAEESPVVASTLTNIEISTTPCSNEGCDSAAPAQILRRTSVAEEQVFALGTEVVIEGLIKAPGFNGARGTVQSWDAESGRYNVLLSSATESGQCWAKIKSENLRQQFRQHMDASMRVVFSPASML